MQRELDLQRHRQWLRLGWVLAPRDAPCSPWARHWAHPRDSHGVQVLRRTKGPSGWLSTQGCHYFIIIMPYFNDELCIWSKKANKFQCVYCNDNNVLCSNNSVRSGFQQMCSGWSKWILHRKTKNYCYKISLTMSIIIQFQVWNTVGPIFICAPQRTYEFKAIWWKVEMLWFCFLLESES